MQLGIAATPAAMGDLASVNLLGYMAGSLVAAAAIRRRGPARVLLWSMIVLGVSLLLLGAVSSVGVALPLMLAIGTSSGLAFVAVVVRLNALAGSRRAQAIGFAASGIGIGTLLASLISSVLLPLAASAWRGVWFAVGGLSFVCALVVRRTVANKGSGVAQDDAVVHGVASPPRPRRLRGRHAVFAVHYLYGLGYFLYITFITAFLQLRRGVGVEVTSGLFLLLGAVSIPAAYWAGVAARRWGYRPVLLVAAGAPAGAAALVLWMDALPAYVAAAALFGGSVSALPALTVTYVGQEWPPGRIAAAYGLLTSGFGVTQAMGPALATRVPWGSDPLEAALQLALGALLLATLCAAVLPERHRAVRTGGRAGPRRRRDLRR
jgi:MFS family permease